MKQYLNSEHISHALANLPQLVFEVTDACNLKCKYCGYGEFYGNYDSRGNKKFIHKTIDYTQYTIFSPYFLQKKLEDRKNSFTFEANLVDRNDIR
jgi:sulfatase maturation enzyme AslB (radical SAM superfamily)